MVKYQVFFYLCIILLCQNLLYGQDKKSTIIDSLTKLDFKQLSNKFYNISDTSHDKADMYAKAYLRKARNNNNIVEIGMGYFLKSTLYPNDIEKRIVFIDSGIHVTKNINHPKFPVFFYMHKGYLYHKQGRFTIALDHYLEGLTYAKETNNLHYIAISNHNIALLKRKFGKYKEAKSLFKKALAYRKTKLDKGPNDSLSYLVTLTELVNTYIQNKDIDSAQNINNDGLRISEGKKVMRFFKLNEGIIYYHKQKYTRAINSITEVLQPEKISYLENHDLIDAYLFLGKSYAGLSNKEEAIRYYKKIDSLAQKSDYLIQETRLAYLDIIAYYKSLGDKNNQLYYINRLLYNDSIFNSNYRYITDKLNKDYEVPILIEEKEKLINELDTRNDRLNYGLLILIFIIGIIIISFIIHYQKNKKYKIRFEELMKEKKKESFKEIIPKKEEIGIADEVVEMILIGLDTFESDKWFLKPNLTSGVLASKLKTNSKYLTKVIKFYRKKSFTHYINDLRVNYIIKELKTNSKFQNYTIKALAAEAGFNSAEVFSKFFYKKTGIYPSYFVKQLQSIK